MCRRDRPTVRRHRAVLSSTTGASTSGSPGVPSTAVSMNAAISAGAQPASWPCGMFTWMRTFFAACFTSAWLFMKLSSG
jgi:hypothetical protein